MTNGDNHEFRVDFTQDEIPNEILGRLYEIWESKCSDGTLPARRDFDPVELPAAVLPWVTIFEVLHDPLRFRIRLVGTGIVEATGVDTTGWMLDEMSETADIIERSKWLVANKKPYFMADLPLTWTHKIFKRYTVLGLPLASNGVDVDMLLFGMYFV